MKGLFITFEGGDGCGKTSHAKLLKEYLDEQGIAAVLTEEPGGTRLGEEVKHLVLDHKYGAITPKAELLLFAAARAEHVSTLIRPALAKGKCVICSRFSDATWVYQGVARGLDKGLIQELARVATEGLKPDLTFLLDIDPQRGLERSKRTEKQVSPKGKVDKIESEGSVFQEKVRSGYLELAKREPKRFSVFSTHEDSQIVQAKIRKKFIDFYHSQK